MRPLTRRALSLALAAGAALLVSAFAPEKALAQSNYILCGYDNGGGGGNYLTSPGNNNYPGYYNCPTPGEIDDSLEQISNDRVKNLVQHNRLASPLLGGTEQINCGNCFRGFGMAGSFSAGFNGRANLTDRMSVLGGLSFNSYDSKSAKTTRAPIFALGLRYDLADWGTSRPFFEVAGTLSPGERVRTARVVSVGGVPSLLVGTTDALTWSAQARAGWVYRVSPVGEFAAYVAFSHTSQRFDGYTERGDPLLLPLTYNARTASMNVVKGVVQHTQLLTSFLEAHVSAGIAHGFGARTGISAATTQPFYGTFTGAADNATWGEFDVRLGFRIAKGTVIDAFALTTVGGKPVGNSVHGGLGLRYLF